MIHVSALLGHHRGETKIKVIYKNTILHGKVKDKFRPRTGHEGPEVE